MADPHFEIAVLGATGLVGEQLLARLAESPLAGGTVRAYGSRASRTDTVEMGAQRLPIDPIDQIAGARIGLAFLCVPPDVAARVGPSLVTRGVFVIDVGDSLAGILDAPLALPGVSLPLPAEAARAGALRVPSAAGWLLARLLAPVRDLGITGVSGVVSLPASAHGRAGVEELSQQVVATFNMQDPQRVVFPEGLAFDTLVEDVPAGEWSVREQLASAEAGELAGVDPTRVAVQVATQPLFTGMTAGLHLRGALSLDAVESAWRDVKGLQAATSPGALRPRRVTGRKGVTWGALRADPAGDGVHVWAAADNVTGPGASVPVRVAEWLHAQGIVGGGEA